MNQYSQTSTARLLTCDMRLQNVMTAALGVRDHSILCGKRGKEAQNNAYAMGHSKLKWPESKHNVVDPDDLSRAVDAAPYPVKWHDPDPKVREAYREECCVFAGIVLAIAHFQGVAIRWGGDWDGDGDLADNRFDDLVHFELRD